MARLQRSEIEACDRDALHVPGWLCDSFCELLALSAELSSYAPTLRATRPEPDRFIVVICECGGKSGVECERSSDFTFA